MDDLSNSSESISRAADNLRDIVADLRECQSRARDSKASQKIEQISAIVISNWVELQSVLDECKSSKKWGILLAAGASAKSLCRSEKIQQLHNGIMLSRDEPFRWISASTQ
ncbi:hypothetical protein GGS21DRAFT_488261 [Xylaria nigripes]|nr:hypothetical protein GGS21DRAFT_488261 [Xylaria nigripes]